MNLDKAIEILTKHLEKWSYYKDCDTLQAVDTLIAAVTITNEIVERAATVLYIRDNAPHIPKSKRNDFILSHEPISVSVNYRRKAKAALTAALQGGGDECLAIKLGFHMTEFAKVITEKLNGERDKYAVKYPNGKKIYCVNYDAAKHQVEEYNLKAVEQLKIKGYSE
jgi:hypothetical protein